MQVIFVFASFDYLSTFSRTFLEYNKVADNPKKLPADSFFVLSFGFLISSVKLSFAFLNLM